MENAVLFDSVNFSYKESPVLIDVSFSIAQNEFVGIIGPNGGGKTTLLKLIMGFLNPTSGHISVLNKLPGQARQRIAYVPQNLRYDREFPISVLELVLLGRLSQLSWYGCFSNEDLAAAEKALNQVGLSHLKQKSFGKLSGGQQQRALIARALASEPQLLLLDEPTASVDTQAQAEIYEVLKQLKERLTLLIVTHDLKIAIEQVDRVLCVQNHLISYSPQEVCEHYAMGLYHSPLIHLQKGKP